MDDSATWRDASVLADAIEAHHPDPFRAVSRAILCREAARIDALSARDRSVVIVELMRMLALLGPRNGHSVIFPLDDHPTVPRAYPLRLSEFEDGMFVVGSARHDLVGAELLGIGGSDVGDILAAVTPLVAHDNEWTIRARRPAFLVDACVLRGLGVIDEVGRTNFRLRDPDGSVVHAQFDAMAVGDYFAQAANLSWSPQAQPTYLRRRNELHWVEHTADGRAVHIGYNVTLGDIAAFAQQVAAFAAAPGTRVIVLDLRLNGGGDNRTYGPLLETLIRLATDTSIAVLTSRETFSAAIQFVIDLEKQTSAIFVGEPTGGSPNHFGNATMLQLPNSRLNAHVATVAWTTAGKDDERLTREPDIFVTQQSGPYFSGKDPTLITALNDVP
jgi:Peptidase family S41